MKVIWIELDEKWIGKEKIHNFGISVICVYPVDRPPSRSTGHIESSENQVSVNCYLKCTDSVPGRQDPVLGRPDTQDSMGIN